MIIRRINALVESAISYCTIGDNLSALPLFEEAFNLMQQISSINIIDKITVINYYALCIKELGDLTTALKYHKEALALCQNELDSNHIELLTSLNNVAECYRLLGDIQVALSLHEEVSIKLKDSVGDLHPYYISSLNNIALCYLSLGKYQKAIEIHNEAYAMRLHIHGKYHHDTLQSLNNLAQCYLAIEDYEKAFLELQDAFSISQNVLGYTHPGNLFILHNIAICYNNLGNKSQALSICEYVVDRRKYILGEDHQDTLCSLSALGTFYSDLGYYDKAFEISVDVNRIAQKALGIYHPDSLLYLSNMIAHLAALGDKALVSMRFHIVIFLERLGATRTKDERWPKLVTYAVAYVAQLYCNGIIIPNWSDSIFKISRVFIEDLDILDFDLRANFQDYFFSTHNAWLSVSLEIGHTSIPFILSAMQGKEMSAILLQNAGTQHAELPDGDLRKRYLEVLADLRALRLRLNNQNNQFFNADFGSKTSEAAQLNLDKQTLARYDAVYAEFKALRQQLAELYPEFGLTRGHLDVSIANLSNNLAPNSALVLLFVAKESQKSESVAYAWVLRSGSHVPLLKAIPQITQWLRTVDLFGSSSRGLLANCEEAASRTGLRDIISNNRSAKTRIMPESEVEPTGEAVKKYEPITPKLRVALWNILEMDLQGINTVHLVTHDVLQGLPVELGAPDDMTVLNYPGLLFYYQCRPPSV